ncbi:MAG: tripartite tricarboxylate transporter protein TctA [Hoeflea sp.]|uniref:tripartite tricarboxylate transporter permease n=1 Tax=Hoeflea sp. TaxID=1940281 RepID=UPI000C0EE93A|nr:tripartite tricarboxylate transporter permease [Hoeflea sp.]PHR20628.1 MAG: tripartite tricarboxylate transporter protein TctA [Hoeflea sp.]
MFDLLREGLPLFFNFQALLLTALGIVGGLVIGVLPGLGPLMGIVLLLPLAFHLPPIAAMGMLIAIYVGGSAGGSVSSILLRIPGTPLAAATLFDGYPMAQQGRAQDAVGLALTSSALGGLIAGLMLVFFSPLLAQFALRFAPPEYFAMAVLGVLTIALVSEGSALKGLLAGGLGLFLSMIGTDEFTNAYRFTFGDFRLSSGPHLVAVVVGLFALSEIFSQLEAGNYLAKPTVQRLRISFRALRLVMTHKFNLLRSSMIGTFFGAVPGAGGDVSAFISYAAAKRFARADEKYGEGAEGGVVATEAANNGCCGGALIPTLSLGIPGDASTAVLMGALILFGFFPGPDLFRDSPDVAGGIFIAYIMANIMLLVLGIILAPIFGSVLKLRKAWLLPAVLLLSTLGTYSLQNSIFDLWVMLTFGVVGYVLRRAGYPLAPLIIGMILGGIMEANLRRSLLISRDGLGIFFERPICATILAIDLFLLLSIIYSTVRSSRKGAGENEKEDPQIT